VKLLLDTHAWLWAAEAPGAYEWRNPESERHLLTSKCLLLNTFRRQRLASRESKAEKFANRYFSFW
jgi:hypothetical protein